MMYFLGRPSAQLVTTKRSGLEPTEQVFPVEVMQMLGLEFSPKLVVHLNGWNVGEEVILYLSK